MTMVINLCIRLVMVGLTVPFLQACAYRDATVPLASTGTIHSVRKDKVRVDAGSQFRVHRDGSLAVALSKDGSICSQRVTTAQCTREPGMVRACVNPYEHKVRHIRRRCPVPVAVLELSTPWTVAKRASVPVARSARSYLQLPQHVLYSEAYDAWRDCRRTGILLGGERGAGRLTGARCPERRP